MNPDPGLWAIAGLRIAIRAQPPGGDRRRLQPVFFGETLVGTKLPNLTYMLVFDDMAARDKNWATFVGDPEWKKLSTTPGYTNAEILTNITNVFLRPTAYSQI